MCAVCCVGCCCNCDVSAHAQAGRQAGKCMEIITALTTHGVMMWGFFYACFHPVQTKYLLVDLVALTTSDLRPPAQPQKISTSHAVGLKLLL